MLEHLPDVVIRSLLTFLDTPSKLALRLTCKTTFEFVTNREFLENLKVNLTLDQDLLYWTTDYEFLSCREDLNGWSNFYLEKPLTLYTTSILDNFLQRMGPQIKKLELFHCSPKDDGEEPFWKPLSQHDTSSLTCLTIQDLDISTCTNMTFLQMGSSNCNPCPFPSLKTFSVQKLSFSNPVNLDYWLNIFKLFALNSATLIAIPAPCYQNDGSGLGLTWLEVKTLQWTRITQPMLNALHESCSTNRGRKILLDVKHLVPTHFGPLVERVDDMNRQGESSTNIYFSQVHSNHVKNVFLQSGEDNFLGRIISLREKIDDRRPLGRWTCLEELSIRSSRCDVRNYYDDGAGVIFPALKKMAIVFDSKLKDDVGFCGLHRLITLLFKVKRVTVVEVVLNWGHLPHTPKNVVDLVEIVENFAILKKLVVISKGVARRIV